MAISIAQDVPIYLCQNVVCRLCGCTGNSTSYLLLKQSCYLVKMIRRETQIQISDNDSYPKTVCRGCVDKIHMIEHFRAHCKKTQRVLAEMASENDIPETQLTESNHIKTHHNQPVMIEEWLDDEFDNLPTSKPAQDNSEQVPYVVLYEDPTTFRSIKVSVHEEQLPDNARIVPSKILGQQKKQRVKPINETHLRYDKVTSEMLSEGTVKKKIILDSNAYIELNRVGQNSYPLVFRVLEGQTEKSSGNKAASVTTAAVTRRDKMGRIYKTNSHTYVDKSSNKYRCMLCDKLFQYRFTAELHVRQHTGERPFKCEKCGKAFMSGFALSKHEKSHGEVQFICEVCGTAFRQEFQLRYHQSALDIPVSTAVSSSSRRRCSVVTGTFTVHTREVFPFHQ